jgi:cation diffusion facilitator CzcD-associated flavoprotein CzcO
VDLRKGGITAVTPSGIETEQGHFDLDVIVWATGFDAMTGALNRIEVRGRDDRLLRDVWTSEGAVSYLGLQVAGFPNLFTITGPGSPSVLANMLFGIEQHVDWIAGCLLYMREQNLLAIEATEQAQTDWVTHVASLVSGSIRSHPTCNSWYLGANIPGKKRVYMPYVGGQPTYREKCEEILVG